MGRYSGVGSVNFHAGFFDEPEIRDQFNEDVFTSASND